MHRIGTAGWTLSAKPKAEGSHLFHYARVMNCVEINSSFYRPHRAATWARWAAETPEDFRFSVKAPKTITHEAKLLDTAPLLREFIEQVEPMRPKLGPLLFQLPPSLEFEGTLAGEFLEVVRSLFSGEIALEPRHSSWFAGEADELLRMHGVTRVAADPAKAGLQALVPAGDTGLVYYRLHGSPRMYYSSYDETFLRGLADRVARHSNAWVIFDNTAHGHAFGNAVELQKLVAS